MNKTGKKSVFKASLLAGLLAAGLNVEAAGLGKLMVYSAIGQPLNAEVAVTATPEELNSLTAKLASHDAFRDAGIDLMPALTGLRFNVVKQPGGQSVLKLSTDRPLNEPFLHFLIELNWTAGRMVREYTFLLDPPEMLQVAKPASVVVPAVPSGQPIQQAPLKATPLPRDVSVTERVTSQTVPAGEYLVKSGDTLGKIARETRLDSVTLDQMLVALFNSNRNAFDGNNMNRLRAGKILRVPDAVEAAATEQKQARNLVIGQAAEFNAYKRRLAEAAGAAPAAPVIASQQATGKITTKIEDRTPPAPTSDKLEVSRTEAGKSGATDGRKHLEEDLIARDKALREANTRIVELEKNLENLKKLVELKSQAGAQVQQQAQTTVAPAKPEEKKPEPAPVPQQMAKPVEEPKPAEEPLKTAAMPAAPASVAEKSAEPPPPAPPKPEVKKPVPPPPPPPPPPDFIEENPELVFGGGGILALLLGYLGYSAWRKKKQKGQDFVDQPSISESDVASKSGAVFGTASETVDNGEVSIQGDFSESGVLTTEESVDPVAEADVLMAYGRDGQAEEILLEGLKKDPGREAIHLKLLELYANRGSTDRFEAVAIQLHQINGGQGSEWEKAVVLAKNLGVTSSVFAGDVTATELTADAETSVPEPVEKNHTSTVIMPEPAVASTPETEEQESSLDFDLDLGTTSGPAMAAAAEKSAATPAADEAVSLDFDFDLGSPEAPVAPVVDVAIADEPKVPAADGNAIDFSLDGIGGSSAAPVEESPSASVEEANNIDFEFDLGSPATSEPDMSAPEQVKAADESEMAFDLDLGAGLDDTSEAPELAVSAPVVEAPGALDLSSISLDLDEPVPDDIPLDAVALPEIDLPAAESPAETEGSFDLALDIGDVPQVGIDQEAAAFPLQLDTSVTEAEAETPEEIEPAEVENPEVTTKLELAQAYEEMGDLEGARELLTEVLGEGSSAQKAAAQVRLDKLKG